MRVSTLVWNRVSKIVVRFDTLSLSVYGAELTFNMEIFAEFKVLHFCPGSRERIPYAYYRKLDTLGVKKQT